MNLVTEMPKIGLLIVGDEILSGLRQDKHLTAVIERLNQRGLALSWVQIIGDDRHLLTETFKRTFESDHIVLSCGGIGGTPDDHTRQAAAQALGCKIVRSPDAVRLIEERCAESGQVVDEYRLRMADFPEGSELIPNPFNKIAGFSIKKHHFVPGFPIMAWPMIEWVLDTHYLQLHHTQKEYKRALRLYGVAEATITPIMESLEAKYCGIKLYSLPHVGDDQQARHIELGVKFRSKAGQEELLNEVFACLLEVLKATAGRVEEIISN